MIIQSVSTVNDIVNHHYRSTLYKTIENPVTGKKTIDVVQFIYNKVGELEPTHKNNSIDKKA